MKLNEIRKWDTDFLNINNVNYPKPQNVTHRLVTNILYYSNNYILLFIVIVLINW